MTEPHDPELPADQTPPAPPPRPAEPRGTWPGMGPTGGPSGEPVMPPLLGSGPAGPPRFPPAPPDHWPSLVPPPPPPIPPTPPSGGPGGPDRRWIAVVALIAAIVLAASVLVALTRDDDKQQATSRDPAATTTTTTTTEPSDSTTTTEPPDTTTDDPSSSPPPSSDDENADFNAVIDEVKRFVERERGLLFKEDVKVELAGEGAFQDRLLEDFEESIPELKEQEQILKGLGLIEPDLDLEATYRNLLEIGVVGFYDPATGTLVVRGTDTGPYVRQVIAHELVHALDDQHFELERPELENTDDETGFGFTALVEGNARRIEDLYAASLSDAEQQQAFEDQLDMQADSFFDLLTIPEILIDLISLPYEVGPDLIEAILDAGGQAQLDQTYGAPPNSTEQVLDPDRFLAGEAPIAVTTPAADGTAANKGVLGQYVIERILDEVDGDVTDAAVEGWGGDAYVTWAGAGGQSCIRFTVVGDTAADTDELATAFDDWSTASGATVEVVGGQSVTVTSCR